MKHTNAYYLSPSKLFGEHGANTPSQFAKEAYDRTQCGVWTTFITMDDEIPSADLNKYQDTMEWAMRHLVGVKFGTIVEGSDAEFTAAALLFPFSDKELAETWQWLEDQADEAFKS